MKLNITYTPHIMTVGLCIGEFGPDEKFFTFEYQYVNINVTLSITRVSIVTKGKVNDGLLYWQI